MLVTDHIGPYRPYQHDSSKQRKLRIQAKLNTDSGRT